MPQGFKWKLGDYVGGDKAVHQGYKPYLVIKSPRASYQAVGEFLIQPRDTADLQVSGLGFTPTVVMLISYRPKLADGATDSSYGARGGGMTFGVAGWSTSTTTPWDSGDAYVIGDQVVHATGQYVAATNHTNSEPPSADWSLVSFAQFSGSTKIRHAFEVPGARWTEAAAFNVCFHATSVPILTLSLASFESDGFTLSQDVNLYDQTDYVAWIALGGKYSIGVIDAGDTTIGGFDGTPGGAMFLSVKHRGAAEPDPFREGYWDHMTGFASDSGAQAVIWGGRRPTSWDWTTERWEDDSAILLCNAATGSFFAGTSVAAQAQVSIWNPGGIDLSWSVFDNQPYRIGYLLAETAEMGVIETSWETRPNGTLVDADGLNFVATDIRPDVVLMAATNYNFDRSNVDPYDMPRSAGSFWKGGSGGLGWHAAPFSELGYDAWGVHTAGNAVAEIGHYANSSTQYMRRSILAGWGSNSQPPAYPQHSVNIVGNPVIVGTNYRYAERHAAVHRLHVNQSDTPEPP